LSARLVKPGQGTACGLVVDRFGPWRSSVRLGDLPLPRLGERDVLIAVEAASLNFSDILMIEGSYQDRPTLPFIPGRDAAGRVLEVGSQITDLSPGDRVVTLTSQGAFADRLVAPRERVIALPAGLRLEAAAAAVTAFATAHVALIERGQVRAGERVLVTGAAGGVGAATIQLARAMGAEVAGLVSSADKARFVEDLGAALILRGDEMTTPRDDLRTALSDAGWNGVDLVIDMVGGEIFEGALRCVSRRGRLVVVGFTSGVLPVVKANYLLVKEISVVGSSLENALSLAPQRIASALQPIFGAMAAGRFDPSIDRILPLHRFSDAAALIMDRAVMGKMVLDTGAADGLHRLG
jgi:NADPH2:quinone reductase